jgi:hypothetical protein
VEFTLIQAAATDARVKPEHDDEGRSRSRTVDLMPMAPGLMPMAPLLSPARSVMEGAIH